MKPISLNTVDASASTAEALYENSSRILHAINDQSLLTEIMTSQMMDVLDQPASDYGVTQSGNKPLSDLVYVSPAQRRRVLFLIGETEGRFSKLHNAMDKQNDCLFEFHQSTLDVFSDTLTASTELEDCINTWKFAYEKWCERRSLGDDSGGPESKAEDLAAEALLNYQCRTHADVQRKLSLFASIDHLGSLVGSYPETFLPTVILAEGGAA